MTNTNLHNNHGEHYVRGPYHEARLINPNLGKRQAPRERSFDLSDYSAQYNMPLREMFKGNNGRDE